MSTQQLLTELASAIRSERKARDEGWAESMQATWRQAVDDRLEALALMVNHGIEPSKYADERAMQVDAANLAKIFRAGGTY